MLCLNSTSKKELLYNTCDNIDCISQTIFWIEENNQRKVIYTNYNNIKFYYETSTILRCFEIESLQYLKTHKIFLHPISLKPIPNEIFDNIAIIDDNTIPIPKLAFDVFQLFHNMNIYIDHELFLLLEHNKLLQLYNEITSIWKTMLSLNDRIIISRNNNILDKCKSDLINYHFEDIQRYILKQIKLLLEYEGEHKILINHIILESLKYIIPEINTDYY